MNISDLDIVYFLKDSAFNEELRYSLRSVEQNFPHRRVVFYGGHPCGLVADKQVTVHQKGKTKWDRVRQMYQMICSDKNISDPFILFNDDFFVMQPVSNSLSLAYFYGSLDGLIFRIKAKNRMRETPYALSLGRTKQALASMGYTDKNFELHIPMAFYKDRLRQIIEMFPNTKGTRSLYGNVYLATNRLSEPYPVPDVKVVDMLGVPPKGSFASTSDESFRDGLVGKLIRSKFPNKSHFER